MATVRTTPMRTSHPRPFSQSENPRTGADLTYATLTAADLTLATLIGADLTGATLTGAYWKSVEEPKFPSGYTLSVTYRYLILKEEDGGFYRVQPFKNPNDPEATYVRLMKPSK